MSRPVLSSLLLVFTIGLVPQAAHAVQASDQPTGRGPRFLLASAARSKPVPVDVARTTVLRRQLSLQFDGATLKEALAEISRQAGLSLVYADEVLPVTARVDLQAERITVAAALTDVLLDAGVDVVFTRDGRATLVKRPRPVQAGSIVGTVRDASTGAALPRATVTVLGARLASESDAEGRYAIPDVPPGAHRLRARLLGYAPADTSVVIGDGQQATVDFRLQTSAIELDPIVSIGYATARKRDLTGAVASVSGDAFATKAAPTVTLSSGLMGKAAGVQVVSTSGLPGANLRVRVRGTNSLTANSEPLYVIDGLPAEQGTSSSNPQVNPLISIDANEIESIDVLKDVSATAIYGARGANGVVLITTKRGRRGENRVTVETSYGFQKISKTIPVLNAREFMELTNEARINSAQPRAFSDSQIATATTYDYPGMMLRTAPQSSQSITLSGGDQRLRYLLSGNYTQQEGILIGSDFERYGLRLNLDSDVSDRFRVGTSLSLSRTARNAARVEAGELGNSANGIQAAMQFAPFAAPRDAAGNWIKTSPSGEPTPNPVANATELKDLNTFARLLGNAYVEFDVTPALRVRSTLGGNFQFDKIQWFAPRTILAGGTGGSAWVNSSEGRDLTNENTATYRGTLGPGTLDVLGGFSVQTFYDDDVNTFGANFPTDATTHFNLGTGAQLVPPGSGVGESAILSYIGRANYNVKDRYLFTLTARSDGSSRFGANNKWAFFPSAAFAWRMSGESFMQSQSLFSDLKLRLSYGQVGSQAVESYQSLARLGVAWAGLGSSEVPALAPGGDMPNPDVRWEQQTQLNAGLDAVFLDDRVTLSLDAYSSKTEDLLLFVSVPSTTGFGRQLQNVGSVRNTGLEVALTTVNVNRPRARWSTTLTFAHNRNRVLDLGTVFDPTGIPVPRVFFLSGRTTFAFSPGETHTLRVGEPIGSIYGYRVTGLWQAGDQCYLRNPSVNCVPGEYRIVDQITVDTNTTPDGIPDVADSVITADDRVILGRGDPKFYGGLSNSVTYGRFSLDALLTFAYGNKIVNGGNAYGGLAIMQANERRTVLDRWTPANTNTDVPRANQSRPRRLYSTLVEDGSYLRLQSLTLGYELPPRLIRGVESARLFLTGQNLFVISGYSGFDPDVYSMGGDARFGGIDIGAYPRARVWNLGLSVTF